MAEAVDSISALYREHHATFSREPARPTPREWRFHIGLFLLTGVTAATAWIISNWAITPPMVGPERIIDYVWFVPFYLASSLVNTMIFALAHPRVLFEGVVFSTSLLAILLSHELGHYIACRIYRVEATLPYFIPAPPIFIAGTLGAFIKIKSPIPNRRALFDIGVAGPIAGFVVAIPIALLGVLTAPHAPVGAEFVLVYNDPILMRLIGWVFRIDLSSLVNAPLYFAAWIGCLITSLNLMPVGQLDGGHAIYALFGRRAHRFIGFGAFVSIACLSALGLYWHGSPSGLLYVILLGIMLRIGHPQLVEPVTPLDAKRIAVAIITLLVFVASFLPFPITFVQ